jgi:hypothetical protein
MTSLDTLARNAADAVHESVADLPTSTVPVGAAATAAAAWHMVRYATAGAAAGVAVVAALIVVAPDQGPVTTETSVTTTVAAPSTTAPPATTVPPVATTVPPETTTVPAPIEELPVVPGAAEPTSTTTTTEADAMPPVLQVSSPTNGEHFETEIVTFTGITEPGAKVTASGKYAASVASNGDWAIDLVLAPGANGVVFTAADAAGNVSQARLTVYLDIPKETTTTTKAEKGWEFSAFQKYGSCSEPIPYDEFSGTGKPGSTISVTSEYASGSTTVNEDGTFWLRVDFPAAPFEKTFPVKVKDEFGNKKVFEFVSNYSG